MRLLKKFLLVFLLASAYAVSSCAEEGQEDALTIVTADGKSHSYTIELALTEEEMARGLMNRMELAPAHGMLFVFSDDAEHNFWMKDTYIPLDIIFIKKDGVIHHIHENAVPLDMTQIPSKGPIRAVLEVNGGETARLGIKPGDIVHHSAFGNRLAE